LGGAEEVVPLLPLLLRPAPFVDVVVGRMGDLAPDRLNMVGADLYATTGR